jgi:hypothetical protein
VYMSCLSRVDYYELISLPVYSRVLTAVVYELNESITMG